MAAAGSILIVDDDAEFRAALVEHFAQSGAFVAEQAATLAEAHAKLGPAQSYQAVILDLCLPDGDGSDFCAQLRRSGIKIPILMLTGADAEADVVRGLDAGANDYIAKPVRVAELLARLRAQLRLFESSEDATFAIGPYVFQPSKKRLHDKKKNRSIRLTGKEVDVLKFLHKSRSEGATHKMMLHEIWGYHSDASTHTLETHIYRLRQKIESDPSSPALLITDAGRYCLRPDTLMT